MIARRAERFRVALDACLGADHGAARRLERARRRRARAALGARLGRAAPARAPLGPPACRGADLGHALDRGRSLVHAGAPGARRRRRSSCSRRRSTCRHRRASISRATPRIRARAGWDQAIADHIAAIVRASEGRALCLFTSWRALEAVRKLVAAETGAYPLLVQGEAPRERLLEAFRADVHSVLLATQSFWQGVDIRGEACSCVIIDRLPFAVPSDPLVAGRCEQIVRDGGSAFDDYALPAGGADAAAGLRPPAALARRPRRRRGARWAPQHRSLRRAAAGGAAGRAARARDRRGRGVLRRSID